jgi:lysophospholipase L1-like esterase
MRTMILILVAFVCVYAMYGFLKIHRASVVARDLIRDAKPYMRNGLEYTHSLLVLGDSTAVGVGSTPEKSVPRQLAEYLSASVENYAKSGAVISDIAAQRTKARNDSYDTILIQIGANDILRVSSLSKAAAEFDAQLEAVSKISDRVIVLTAGDVGNAPVFVWPLSTIVSYRTQVLREYFIEICKKHSAIYIDIYAEPDIISTDIQKYYAPDRFHLSGEGYAYWFSLVVKQLEDTQQSR